ncbi:hypothetical protein GE061_018090 [Apolygus lucorum]|uniref:Uncharacterized protein n=1 Tax=Apolygus lucorum TaxID=248454 RepID=A0A6A4IV94_APOLU|nr:hypothetical protein GE061_018090 [Apolygus lucorum]
MACGSGIVDGGCSRALVCRNQSSLWWDHGLTCSVSCLGGSSWDWNGKFSLDVLQGSLIRQGHLESELKIAEEKLKVAERTIDKLSRELGTLAVAYGAASDAIRRIRVVLECVLSGKFSDELGLFIHRNALKSHLDNQIALPSETALGKLSSLARGLSKEYLVRYITRSLGLTCLEEILHLSLL